MESSAWKIVSVQKMMNWICRYTEHAWLFLELFPAHSSPWFPYPLAGRVSLGFINVIGNSNPGECSQIFYLIKQVNLLTQTFKIFVACLCWFGQKSSDGRKELSRWKNKQISSLGNKALWVTPPSLKQPAHPVYFAMVSSISRGLGKSRLPPSRRSL